MLKYDFSKIKKDAQEFEFRGGKLNIRMYPANKESFIMSDKGVLYEGEKQKQKFIYVLVNWDAKDNEGKSIKCSDENKAIIFDNNIDPELVNFSIAKADEIRAEQVQIEKN